MLAKQVSFIAMLKTVLQTITSALWVSISLLKLSMKDRSMLLLILKYGTQQVSNTSTRLRDGTTEVSRDKFRCALLFARIFHK